MALISTEKHSNLEMISSEYSTGPAEPGVVKRMSCWVRTPHEGVCGADTVYFLLTFYLNSTKAALKGEHNDALCGLGSKARSGRTQDKMDGYEFQCNIPQLLIVQRLVGPLYL